MKVLLAPDSFKGSLTAIEAIEARIDLFNETVNEVVGRARYAHDRGNLDIAGEARVLAMMCTHPSGLMPLLGPGVHPQLDYVDDVACRIPWEVLDHPCFRCDHKDETGQDCGEFVIPGDASVLRCRDSISVW